MSVAQTIYSRLTAAQSGDDATRTAALTALTAAVGTQIYPGVSDRGTYPLINYRIHREKEDSIQVQRQQEYTMTLVLVTRGAAAYLAGKAILDSIHTLLDRQTWTVAGTLPTGGWTTRCFLNASEEDVMADGGNAEALYYEFEEEYRVWSNA